MAEHTTKENADKGEVLHSVLSCAKHVEFMSECRHPFFILLFTQVPEWANVLAHWMCS